MQTKIQNLLNDTHNKIINRDTTIKIALKNGDNLNYTLPIFNILTNRYFFELALKDNYSLIRTVNNDYKNEDVMIYLAGWNDFNSEQWNNGIVFNGDLKYLKEQVLNQYIKTLDFEDFQKRLFKGGDENTFNYTDEWFGKLFFGIKLTFIFRSLLLKITEKEGVFYKINIYSIDNIGKLWLQLLDEPELNILELLKLLKLLPKKLNVGDN